MLVGEHLLILHKDGRRRTSDPQVFTTAFLRAGHTFEYSIFKGVLRRVIEVVSGKPLHQYIPERVTGPLGLHTLKFQIAANAPFAFDPLLGPLSQFGSPSVNPLRAKFDARFGRGQSAYRRRRNVWVSRRLPALRANAS